MGIEELALIYNNKYEKLKISVQSCFYKWIVTDPYPDLATLQMIKENKSVFDLSSPESIFENVYGRKPNIPTPHQAWREGYEFAKKLALDETNKEIK